jgi:hypothetical protein
MNIIEKIKAKSSRKNRRTGRIATAISGGALLIAESGIVDSKPQFKTVLWIVSGIAGIVAGNRAIQTK